MKVVVKKYLNVRVGKPSVNAPCYQYLAPGSELEVDGKIYIGDMYDNSNTWYKDLAGNYYWSGGLEDSDKAKSEKVNGKPFLELINYNEWLSGVPDEIRNSYGKNIRIAVLDSGINEQHSDLAAGFNNQVLPSYDFTKSTLGYGDKYGHGSHVAGLIGARSATGKGIEGVAKACLLQNIKVVTDQGNCYEEPIVNGLDQLLKQTASPAQPDIVNLSLSVKPDVYDKISAKLALIAGSSVIIASAGEDEFLLKEYGPYCPALSPHVISVGTVSSSFLKSHPNAVFHSRVNYLIPDMAFYSCSTTQLGVYKRLQGSSMAAALVSGIIALILAANGKKGVAGAAYIRGELDKLSSPFNETLNVDVLQLIKPAYI